MGAEFSMDVFRALKRLSLRKSPSLENDKTPLKKNYYQCFCKEQSDEKQTTGIEVAAEEGNGSVVANIIRHACDA